MVLQSSIALRWHGDMAHPLVGVLHGGPGAIGSAAGLARALASEFRVLEPLQRRSGTVPLTVATHVSDLARVAPRRMLWVGHSWGAMLALSFAAAHPELVQALVLVGCGTYDDAARQQLRERLNAGLDARGLSAKLGALHARALAAPDDAARDRLLLEQGRITSDAETYELCEPNEYTEVDARAHRETWDDVLRLQREGVEPAAFAGIHAPVLMLHGDFDPHPGPETRDVLRRVIPQLEYTELARCGHEPWRERHAREPFLNKLRAWLHSHT